MTGGKATKHIVETIAKVIFLICAAVAIVAVLSITVYMFAKGTPALAKVGAIDLFEYDPIHRRAGIGILIYEQSDRGRGYASDAVETLCRYAHDTLRAHQLWCNVGADNEASLRLFRSAGFTEIGVKRDWLWRPDGYHDEVMLQKIFD